MFIKYDYTADGKPIMVEVTEEVAEFIREDKRLTENAERKERYHCPYSIDALEYEGRAYYYRDTPEQIVLRNERNRVLYRAMDELYDTQFRRLILYADGMSFREIAAMEGKDFSSIAESINAAKKKVRNFL